MDEYLRLRAHERAAPVAASGRGIRHRIGVGDRLGSPAPSCAPRRRRSPRSSGASRSSRARSRSARTALADHDQADYVGLGAEMARIAALESERDDVEARWFELTELLG